MLTGVRVAKVAEAMGMTVIRLNSKSHQEELFQMLQQADVVSLHCPLTPDTYHLRGSVNHMKRRERNACIECQPKRSQAELLQIL